MRAKHGVAGYQHDKCRCPKCTNAWRLYKKLYRRRRRIALTEKGLELLKRGKFAEGELVLATIRNKS